LVIAAEHARFGLPEVKVGVFPMQVLVFLRSTMHARHINELCLTGELVSAQRAAEMGIVNEIAPAGELDSRVEALLAKIRLGSPAAIRRGKQAILTMEMLAFHEAIALQAFNEKRKPRWSNPED
jgi:enoyl-CoA hydratase/carnithine racemase